MNARERFLAIVLIGIMFLFVGGFGAYQFVYAPWKKSNEELLRARDEVDKLELDRNLILQQQDEYEKITKQKSLPLDTTVAQREYERLLDGLMRKAQFKSPKIDPRQPNIQNVPTIGNKKPIYTKLPFDVKVKGDLFSFVDFLYAFYRQPLLHQIRSITIVKPSTRVQGQGSEDLEISMMIEALVLDRAGNRPMLFAPLPGVAMAVGGAGVWASNTRSVDKGEGSPYVAAGVLARVNTTSKSNGDNEYRRIAGRNMFYGPPPEDEAEIAVNEVDLAPHLSLIRVSHSQGKSEALIFDRWNNEDYEIQMDPMGKVQVTRYYHQPVEDNHKKGVARHKWETKPYLQFGKEDTGNLRRFFVRRILESQILIEEYSVSRELHTKGPVQLGVALTLRQFPPFLNSKPDPELTNKMYLWRVGQLLKSQDIGRGVLKAAKNENEPERPDPVLKPNEVWYELVRPLNLSNSPSPVLVEELPKPRPQPPLETKKELTDTRGTIE